MHYSPIRDPLHHFRTFQVILAIICIAIPALLKFSDKDEYYPRNVRLMNLTEMQNFLSSHQMDSVNKVFNSRFAKEFELKYQDSTIEINGLAKIPKDAMGFRMSVSDYAYSSNSYLFGMLYLMAALLYIYTGVVYVRTKRNPREEKIANVAHVLIGLFLIGVILNPESRNLFFHNFFSIAFFVGNICLLLFFKKYREKRWFKVTRIAMGITCLLVLIGSLFLKLYSVLWAEWICLTIIASYLIMVSIAVHREDIEKYDLEKARTTRPMEMV